MSKRVVNTNVYLYDKVRNRILWWVGRFNTITETFAACKEFAAGIGQHDAFLIPGDEDEKMWFDSKEKTKFCFQIKINLVEIAEEDRGKGKSAKKT